MPKVLSVPGVAGASPFILNEVIRRRPDPDRSES